MVAGKRMGKQAILMYFAIRRMETFSLPPFEFYDKMKLKSNYAELGVRAVPHAVAGTAHTSPVT
jgi:2,3,4,5-tetrahydropyridine-2-carboxylate N-succinyltransferase